MARTLARPLWRVKIASYGRRRARSSYDYLSSGSSEGRTGPLEEDDFGTGGGGGGSVIRKAGAGAVVRCIGTSGGGSGGNKDNRGSRTESLSFFADLVFGFGSGIGSGKGGDSVMVELETIGVEVIDAGLAVVEGEAATSSF